ncbi:MAG: class I SAM-dependent methyltransferase [Oscillospiraceae bacterium]|nr:class I SAM-dependent methyltransferase [Oscillospiraceae bacterium]
MELKNEERFTNKADLYKKFRPNYPKELINYLYSQVGFNQESIIADIGSGTGIFSRLLLERGSFVYCVEPNEDMRRTAEKDLSSFDNFVSVNAPAENTGLQNKSVDFVTAAQAAHWFDRQTFKSECRRILKPGGKVAFVWNIRDFDSEIVKKEYDVREKYFVDRKGLGDKKGPTKNYMQDFFSDKIREEKNFKNDLQYDKEGFIGMNLSSSFAPKEKQHPEKYHGFVCELSELFDEYSINGILNYPHYTQIEFGRV